MMERLFNLAIEFDVEPIFCQCFSTISMSLLCLAILFSLRKFGVNVHTRPLCPSTAFILENIFCRTNLLFLTFLLSVKDRLIGDIAEILMKHPLEVLLLAIGLGHCDMTARALHSARIESARPELLHVNIILLIECRT